MRRWRAHLRMKLAWIPRPVRRVIILMFGGTVLLIGVIMIIAPGPAFIVLPLGLLILGVEFAFARRWLKKLKAAANSVQQRVRDGISGTKTQERAKPSKPVEGF